MKKTARIITALFFAALFLIGTVGSAFSAWSSDAVEKIDTGHKASMKLTYAIEGEACEGLDIEIFRLASVNEDCEYTLTDTFAAYSIDLGSVKEQAQWTEITKTAESYIIADTIDPDDMATTDENGVVSFADLGLGLYFVRWTGNNNGEDITGFAPFLVMVPSMAEDGKWCYEVDAIPKPATKPEPYKGTVKVIKLWRDGDKIEQRPASITVDIYKNKVLFETVELTVKDNWSYTWDTDEAAIWTVVERSIPEGYAVAVNNGSNGILQITNTAQHEKDPDPVTGDTSNPYLWYIIMAAAGLVLAIAALFLHRKKDAE